MQSQQGAGRSNSRTSCDRLAIQGAGRGNSGIRRNTARRYRTVGERAPRPARFVRVLVNVSSLALPPSLSQSVRACVRPSVRMSQNSSSRKKARSQNSRPQPEKRVGHKTRDPIPKKGSVTKLATPSRKKGRSQNSRPQPEKRVGHKTRDPNPKKGSVTKLATPSRKKGRSQNSRPHHRADPTLATATTNPRSTNNSIHTVRMRADIPHLCGAVMLCIQSAVSPLND